MQTEHSSNPAGASPAKRTYFFETANPPSPTAPRNIGGDDDPMSREFVIHLWNAAVEELPTLFGRLVFLAGLRDNETGMYRHYGFELAVGRHASDAMRATHEATFLKWLGLTIERQKEDFTAFLASAPGHRRHALSTWSDIARHFALIPASAREHERELYFADVEVVLELCETEAPQGSVLDLANNEA